MQDVIEALKAVSFEASDRQKEAIEKRPSDHYAKLARRLGDSLCRSARRSAEGIGWISTCRPGIEISSRDLGVGSAGIVLCLAYLVNKFHVREQEGVLAEGAWSLANTSVERRSRLQGLYAGEAGVGAALLCAGRTLGECKLTEWACECSHRIGSGPIEAPDLFSGAAGRLRFHLLVFVATQDPVHLRYAVCAGDWLLNNSSGAEENLYWTLPRDYGTLSGKAYIGYARGAAGIADVLLDLFERSGEPRFLEAARKCAHWVLLCAQPGLPDGTGLCWPHAPEELPRGAFWCHGASGVGRFLLHAFRAGILRDGMHLLSRVADTVCYGTRWAGPTQCHGLAGNIEFLIDLYRATGRSSDLMAARSLASLLETFAIEKDGYLLWQSDSPEITTPDYLFGYAGTAMSLLRLSDPDHAPHALDLSNFGMTSTPSGGGLI